MPTSWPCQGCQMTTDWRLDLPAGQCDWGDCDALAVAWRYDQVYGWLPVCAQHADRQAYQLTS